MSAGWYVDLVELSPDAEETVVGRFVWDGQGPVTVEAELAEDREEFEALGREGIPTLEGDVERVVTVADGLAFLQALSVRYGGSRFFATEPRPRA